MKGLKVELEGDVVERVITAQIQSAIATALGKDPEAMVTAVVKSALEQKKTSYERGTIFQAALNEMIRDAAKEEFKRWLESNKNKIKAAIAKKLDKQPAKFVNDVANKIVSGLASSFYVNCRMEVED